MATMTIQQAIDRGLQHHRAGQLPEAEGLYRQVLAHEPNNADALHYLGVIAHRVGRYGAAFELIRRAVAINPNLFEAFSNLGNLLADTGQLDEAIATYRRAIALNPEGAEAYCNLGNALKAQRRFDDAIAAYRQAIALSPNLPEAHQNLGAALIDIGLPDEAIAASGQAIALQPGSAGAWANLARALRDNGRLDRAVAACRQAVTLDPRSPEAHGDLGVLLKELGQVDEAVSACRRAIVLKPGYPEGHKNLALALLLNGDLAEGWKEYEWRRQCDDFPPHRRPVQTQWDGAALADHALLLHAEQGFGDTLQFVRYVPLALRLCRNVTVVCHPQLRRLLQSLPGDAKWVSLGEPLPPFDIHCPLPSLPRAFGTTLETIPNAAPYLHAHPLEIKRWRERLDADARHPPSSVSAGAAESQPRARFRVGLAWAGSATHTNDHSRSMSLSSLSPLFETSNVHFHSLQVGAAAQQARHGEMGAKLTDFTEHLLDFADTAALIANLDLVISVDTAVAHLAGAMGKPVWTLLPFAPDWRWMLEREDSPWYPTMRLFRQSCMGDWHGVIARVADELAQYAKNPTLTTQD